MEIVEQFDMPFVKELPRREQTKWQKLWAAWQEIKRMTAEKGLLVPVKLAADLGSVSHQRILQLCEAGKLERIDFHGHVYISEESFLAWAKAEPDKGGRPRSLDRGKLNAEIWVWNAGKRKKVL